MAGALQGGRRTILEADVALVGVALLVDVVEELGLFLLDEETLLPRPAWALHSQLLQLSLQPLRWLSVGASPLPRPY